jgi:hypothetical protein
MAIKGTIYIKDHNGEAVGVGQAWEIMPASGGGYAAFLTAPSDPVQFTEPWESEADCLASLKGGGGVIIIIEDDDY